MLNEVIFLKLLFVNTIFLIVFYFLAKVEFFFKKEKGYLFKWKYHVGNTFISYLYLIFYSLEIGAFLTILFYITFKALEWAFYY